MFSAHPLHIFGSSFVTKIQNYLSVEIVREMGNLSKLSADNSWKKFQRKNLTWLPFECDDKRWIRVRNELNFCQIAEFCNILPLKIIFLALSVYFFHNF